MLKALHHVQLAMPPKQEAKAIAFYAGVLGLTQVDKPKDLQKRGGAWFEKGNLRVHLGVENPFVPAKKAHPAFEVTSLSAVIKHLDRHQTEFSQDTDLPDIKRIYVFDPFGNRIELLEVTASS